MNIVSATIHMDVCYMQSIVFFTDADKLCFTLYLTLCLNCTSVKDPCNDPQGTSSTVSSEAQQDVCFFIISLWVSLVIPQNPEKKGWTLNSAGYLLGPCKFIEFKLENIAQRYILSKFNIGFIAIIVWFSCRCLQKS